MNSRWHLVALCACLIGPAYSQLPATVRSPDTRISVIVGQNDGGQLTYSITRNGEALFLPSALRVRLAEGDLSSVDVRTVNPRSVDQVQKLVATKAAQARDHFNELTITAAPRSRATFAIAGKSCTSNVCEPGFSRYTTFVLGFISAAMPAPISGS